MRWQEAARAILDREIRNKRLTESRRIELDSIVREGNPVDALRTFNDSLASNRKHWNKVLAGGFLFGWQRNVITSESLRLTALDAMQDVGVGEELRGYLNTRWHQRLCSGLSPEAGELGNQLGLEIDGRTLSPVELRFLQRLNLDCRERVIIEKWRWSSLVGVAFLSDDGRETIKPESACARALEVIADDDLSIPDEWKDLLIDLNVENEILLTNGLSKEDEFVRSIEFWGLGKKWECGLKVLPPARIWLKKAAQSFV